MYRSDTVDSDGHQRLKSNVGTNGGFQPRDPDFRKRGDVRGGLKKGCDQ